MTDMVAWGVGYTKDLEVCGRLKLYVCGMMMVEFHVIKAICGGIHSILTLGAFIRS